MTKRVPKRTLTIHGEKWKLIFRAPKEGDDLMAEINPDDQGLCSYDNKTIYIAPNSEALGTGIHEILHACFPDLNEESVAHAEEVLMKYLSKFPQHLHVKEEGIEL